MRGREREPVAVAVEHLDPGEQVVAERHRLRTLQVRVAGHQRLGVLLGTVEDRTRERLDPASRLGAGVERPEPERGDDLVVAGPAGVDLPPDRSPSSRSIAECTSSSPRSIIDASSVGEPRARPRRAPRRSASPAASEPPRVDPRPLDVVGEELGVVGLDELPDLGRELALDASRPERHTRTARARAAASSASSDASRMNPSAASCGKVSPVAYDASVSAYSACSERRPLTTAAAGAQLDAHLARDELLGLVDERVERLAHAARTRARRRPCVAHVSSIPRFDVRARPSSGRCPRAPGARRSASSPPAPRRPRGS